MKKFTFWHLVGAIVTAIFIAEFIVWAVSGMSFWDYFAGEASPIQSAIADKIAPMSVLMFWGCVGFATLLMSVVLSVVFVHGLGFRGRRKCA